MVEQSDEITKLLQLLKSQLRSMTSQELDILRKTVMLIVFKRMCTALITMRLKLAWFEAQSLYVMLIRYIKLRLN